MGWRNIIVDDVPYTWTCGPTKVVVHHEGIRIAEAAPWDLKGISCDAWDRGQAKKSRDGKLMPKHVALFIGELDFHMEKLACH